MARLIDFNGLEAGADILDHSGEVVGSLDIANCRGGYLAVLKGIFFTKGIFLPLSAVDHVSTDGIYLKLSKEELQDIRFEVPPEGKETPAHLPFADTDDIYYP